MAGAIVACRDPAIRPVMIVGPSFDAGRPHDALGQRSLRDGRASHGGGFRVAWNWR